MVVERIKQLWSAFVTLPAALVVERWRVSRRSEEAALWRNPAVGFDQPDPSVLTNSRGGQRGDTEGGQHPGLALTRPSQNSPQYYNPHETASSLPIGLCPVFDKWISQSECYVTGGCGKREG